MSTRKLYNRFHISENGIRGSNFQKIILQNIILQTNFSPMVVLQYFTARIYYMNVIHCSQPSKLLKFSRYSGFKVAQRLLSNYTKQIYFKCIPVIFQHFSLPYCIPLVKDQISFYEIHSHDVCINIKVFNRVNINKYLCRANTSVVTLCTKLYTKYTLLSWRPCKT